MYNQIDSNKRKTVLLVVIFVALILFLGWIFGQLYDYGYAGLILAAGISLAMTLTSYYQGDRVALWTAGAQPLQKNDNPYVYRLVENLCITGGLPVPKVYLINDPAINAFACGRDPAHASLAVTAGAVSKLENEELEGVIAHELSHIKNYDIRLMTIVVVLVGIIGILANFMWRGQIFGGRRGGDRDNQTGGILMVIGLILLILSPIIGELIKLAISRKREFLADASGALLTRYPEGLARALEKISAENLPTQKASSGTAHLYIANPFRAGKGFLQNAFSTHPPITERVAALRKMA
ncbi:MAG: M48 family metallopeptidase [Patescibacteria group bacterium]